MVARPSTSSRSGTGLRRAIEAARNRLVLVSRLGKAAADNGFDRELERAAARARRLLPLSAVL
jgi:hypothetical protein